MSGFNHERIDERPPCTKLGFCLTADLTGNGREDVIVGGAGEGFPGKGIVWEAERRGVPTGPIRSAMGIGEANLFWYENPGFERHEISFTPSLDVGGAVGDLTGSGGPNIVAGQGIDNTGLYWFEPGQDPRGRWSRYRITDRFEKYHDVAVADIDDDGEPEVVGLSQESETVFYYDIPSEPRRSPWDEEHLHIIDEGREVEGLAVRDVTGDGRTELVAGPNVYYRDPDAVNGWCREEIVSGWDNTRVEVADLDDDGELEIVLSEGDSPHLGTRPGRVAWFDPPDWDENVIADELFCPHSLAVEDFTGDGLLEIYVAEMGLGKHGEPRHFLFYNREGEFERETVETGIPTHEAKVVDLTDSGRPDVVGKSYGPDHHVDVWFNRL
ncbi:VCBS repeat-containing protein [Haloarcula onubensis]|uniref:VCBS repeat-containing protein n=1 Tax=Haloarcula onubensis TaxID=2950539 RepID=A0ABU2FLE2_9EURY|nr:VCBS repeat-containing protein [Halomicroarcula sp. S3CR25-11]MDS0281580.1 VCBS repeat-containing protein [Halomicroarcula sp. S3CR25-11]